MVLSRYVSPDARAKADALRVDAQQRVEAIQNNGDLSASARRRELAKTVLAHKAKMRELEAAMELENRTVVQNATRRIFGLPKDPAALMGYRDAQDRAERIDDPHEAMRVLQRAEVRGDGLLAQAIASHAHEQGWSDVLGEWTSTRPEVASSFDEIYTRTGKSSVAEVFAFIPVMTPRELSPFGDHAVSDVKLAQIAEGNE